MDFDQYVKGDSLTINNTAVDIEGLVSFLQSNAHIKKLSLVGSDINAEGAKALADFKNLTELDLRNNNIGDKGAKELAKLENLTSLNLERNKIGDEGVKALANSPHLKNLIFLYLDHNNIGDEGVKALANSPHLKNLIFLYLDHNNIGDEGVKALANSPHLKNLTSLGLGHNNIGDEGAKELADLTNLTSLDLSGNKISNEGAKELAELTNLTSLGLSGNNIGDEGAKELAKLSNLTSLYLSYNNIGNKGAKELAELTNLTSLGLSGNNIGDEGAKALKSGKCPNLTSLDLGWNTIDDELELEECIRRDIIPYLKCFTDQSLRLSKVDFKEAVCSEFRAKNHMNYTSNTRAQERIDKFIEESYEDYSSMCKLAAKGIYYEYRIESQKKCFQYLQSGEKLQKIDRCKPELVQCYILGKIYLNEGCDHVRLSPSREYFSDIISFEVYIRPPGISTVMCSNNRLLVGISCSQAKDIDNTVMQTENINKYSLEYGTNPILLAVSKGWNHVSTESCDGVCEGPQSWLSWLKALAVRELIKIGVREDRGKTRQKDVISALLSRDLDINCVYLKDGMTPLHIASLRGDSPELIQKLLDKGANPSAVNDEGKRPIDLLSCAYEEAQEFIRNITGGWSEFGAEYDESRSYTATLPTREERERNVKKIKEMLNTLNQEAKQQGVQTQFDQQQKPNAQATNTQQQAQATNDSNVPPMLRSRSSSLSSFGSDDGDQPGPSSKLDKVPPISRSQSLNSLHSDDSGTKIDGSSQCP